MADKGIIFSAPMVRALLDGRKTQTRRLLNPQPETFAVDGSDTVCEVGCLHVEGEARPRIFTGQVLTGQKLPYALGDRLYVRETWSVRGRYTDVVEVGYLASVTRSHTEFVEQWPIAAAKPGKGKWPEWPKYGPCIHMPRWASRMWLGVTEMRVQRLQDISEADAIAEGLEWVAPGMWSVAPHMPIIGHDPVKVYSELWDSLHTAEGTTWAANPWVYAVTFEANHGNIDAEARP